MAITIKEIDSAKANDKPYTLADTGTSVFSYHRLVANCGAGVIALAVLLALRLRPSSLQSHCTVPASTESSRISHSGPRSISGRCPTPDIGRECS
jgi:hypothetical protein